MTKIDQTGFSHALNSEYSSDESEYSDIDRRHVDQLDVISRKRRRLSDETAVSSSKSHSTMVPTVSRIRQRMKDVSEPTASVLEKTIISNGKVVDATSSFATLEVAPWLIASLAALAIQRPTAIQKGCIPALLAGSDIIGGSRTGSGKTVAFAVPILQKWAEDPVAIYAVVLTPTR